MRNNRLNASYIKDLKNYMEKYHIKEMKFTITDYLVKLYKLGENWELSFTNIIDYCLDKNTEIFKNNNFKDIIDKLKDSKYYMEEIKEI